MRRTALSIGIEGGAAVSGILQVPARATACCVLAHGAGAGMTHPFLSAVADGLADRGVATLRYQFPFMERGSKRPDKAALAQAAVRAAVAQAGRRLPALPVFAGGKSFGGRMTSQAQAEAPLPKVRGLVFLGFPLHPAKKPSDTRARHLVQVGIPMLFLQGSRDALAALPLVESLVGQLGTRATLVTIDGGDHGFHVPKRSGRTDAAVLATMLDALTGWMAITVRPTGDA
ncbi:alpha/beta hydrolase [Paeniroseomonas aquatica]|uniref:Alpha/beta hydrolase n=1 Tax=Paeniroseomonas aquatica TaxID=373043 RepID=A0ABT8A1K7_9PROT|nr:alpha/beta family hydrolase [Paeniroseomonas aquatica]MDN3563414.1 alpha/beta hydrolase [Paeniroseomonas aquatica]